MSKRKRGDGGDDKEYTETIVAGGEKKRKSRFDTSLPILPPSSLVAEKMLEASELEKQLAQQIAAVSSMLNAVIPQQPSSSAPIPALSKLDDSSVSQQQQSRKAASYRLLLDAQGREIDEYGNLIHIEPVKTLVANVAVAQATKKARKENPYLAHRERGDVGLGESDRTVAADVESNDGIEGKEDIISSSLSLVDDRLVTSNREARARRALQFVEAGSYVHLADQARLKEERKAVAGYTSGRKVLERQSKLEKDVDQEVQAGGSGSEDVEGVNNDMQVEVDGGEASQQQPAAIAIAVAVIVIPPPLDGGVVPSMEWWDESFLPKEVRESKRKSVAAASRDDFSLLAITNSKTYRYVQHPISIKPLGGERPVLPLPMFLTKKERKRIRKKAREEREQEKRDKMLMGLIPPAEPKFKLSNFMKVLGDQAVADPSKVEMKVLQQMRQRQLSHETRNQEAKLTPKERREKKLRKLQEDTSKQVQVALFRIQDFSHGKHRFKVDVNAQQYFLSGIVLLSADKSAPAVIVVEGGPKGIRKFARLMLNRIPWGAVAEDNGGVGDDDDDDDGGENEGDDEEYEGEESEAKNASSNKSSSGTGGDTNRCDMLWQGCVAKRSFTGFRFQECRNAVASKKFLESKQLLHYWEMANGVVAGAGKGD